MQPRDLTVAVLTEAGTHVGQGHLSRCSALAEAFDERGIRCALTVNGDEGLHELPAEGTDIAIVDSYLAPDALIREIAARVDLAVWIDDNGDGNHPAGLVVDGTRSMLLRKAFWEVGAKTIAPRLEHLLLTLGADPGRLTDRVARRLAERFPGRTVTVVRLGLTPGQMREQMKRADLALSAAGQTMIELARCGVPSLIFQTADNQNDNIRGLRQAGFFEGLTTPDTLFDDLDRLEPAEARRERSAAGRRAVDGQGARRVVRKILQEYFSRTMTVRPVREGDRMALFELAGDPIVRQNSFNTAAIPFDDHCRWFDRVLADERIKIMIFESGGTLIGSVRFEARADETVTSLSLSAPFRGLGLGAPLLRRAIAASDLPEIRPVTAYIKPENTASQKTFEQAGYRYDPEKECWTLTR
jgi:spore coat polysaccharide biosynthesis predicted glycosyltransferase SpsG/RimJ/RimL family protein N-acetyltransferase